MTPPDIKAEIAARLNQLLDARNMRPVDLADAANLPKSTISRIVNASGSVASTRTINAVAEALGVSIADLTGGPDATGGFAEGETTPNVCDLSHIHYCSQKLVSL